MFQRDDTTNQASNIKVATGYNPRWSSIVPCPSLPSCLTALPYSFLSVRKEALLFWAFYFMKFYICIPNQISSLSFSLSL